MKKHIITGFAVIAVSLGFGAYSYAKPNNAVFATGTPKDQVKEEVKEKVKELLKASDDAKSNKEVLQIQQELRNLLSSSVRDGNISPLDVREIVNNAQEEIITQSINNDTNAINPFAINYNVINNNNPVNDLDNVIVRDPSTTYGLR